MSVLERFTDQARRAVVLAQEEARLLDHDYIGTEHLLLGVVHDGDSAAAIMLGRCGVTLDAARVEVERVVGRGVSAPESGLRFRSGAKTVLELAWREATHPGNDAAPQEGTATAGRQMHPWIRRVARTRGDIAPGHLLLGLIEEGGVGVEVLDRFGVDLTEMRQAVLDATTEARPEQGEG